MTSKNKEICGQNSKSFDLQLFDKDLNQIKEKHKGLLSNSFNIFEAAGLVRQEIRHSNVLAFLVSPNGSHCLGEKVLEAIFQLLELKSPKHELLKIPNQVDYSDFEVFREEMHLDVLGVSQKNKLVFVIENKVDSEEGVNQLERYRQKITSSPRFKGWGFLFAYLTVNGDKPSDYDWWGAISYLELLDLVTHVFQGNKKYLSQEVQVFLNHYIDLIRKYIVIDKNLREDCLALYKKHKRLIDIIGDIAREDPIKIGSQKFLEDEDLIEEFYYSGKTITRLFFLTKELHKIIGEVDLKRSWAGKLKQRPVLFIFEFSTQKNRSGEIQDLAKLIVQVGPVADSEKRALLAGSLLKEFGFKNKNNSDGYYTNIWGKSKKYINDDANAVADVMNQLFRLFDATNITDRLIKVFNKMEG